MSNPTQSMPAIFRLRLTKTRRVRGIRVGSRVEVSPESGRTSCSNDTIHLERNPPRARGRNHDLPRAHRSEGVAANGPVAMGFLGYGARAQPSRGSGMTTIESTAP